MTEPPSKSSIISALTGLAPEIAHARSGIESSRRLPRDLVDRLRGTGCFGMTLPRAFGGSELDPLEQFAVCEAAARLDASVGWCVMIGSDSGYYSAWLDDEATRRLWPRPDAITAGWLMPGGQAMEVEGGYRVNGQWQFGSGCTHADVIAGGCVIVTADGSMKPGIHPNAPVETRIALMAAGDIEVVDTWHTTGLAGSGSHDYKATDVFVPVEHTFDIFETPRRPGPLYAFNAMFFSNLAAVPIGAAQAAIDDFVELATTKMLFPAFTLLREEARAQRAVAEAEALVSSGRAWAVEVLGELWDTLQSGDLPDERQRARYLLSAMNACQSARQAVGRLYEAAGSSAIYAANPFDRALRDQLTISAHMIASTRNLEPAGRVRLGMPANALMF
jgi:alkylation response protein AidB-like acyl-CoA dehydrogenase